MTHVVDKWEAASRRSLSKLLEKHQKPYPKHKILGTLSQYLNLVE